MADTHKNELESGGLYDRVTAIAEAIQARVPDRKPDMVCVLGSGLGAFVDALDDKIVLPYSEIPGFVSSKVHGHAGNLVFGRVSGHDVVVMQGRQHFYESGDMLRVTMATRVMWRLGCTKMFVTNSAGGVNSGFSAGDLMLITDHINLMMGGGPLIGDNDERFGPRFPDMTEAYNKELRAHVKDAAASLGVSLQEGVYCAFHGPEYETPAEVRMAGILGGDAVGMSTVPEVVVANHMGMKVVGISCISNMAAGISENPLTHDEVMETAGQVSATFVKLVADSVTRILG